MKSYTDIKQSKKLAEILPLESADMWWLYVTSQGKHIAMMYEEPDPHYLARMESYGIKNAVIPCWSLTALLDVIGNIFKYSLDYNGTSFTLIVGDFEITNETTVDVCYEMILKLHEFNLL